MADFKPEKYEDYINIYADHKRNDLEKIVFTKKQNIVLPDLVLVYFKGSIFKIRENEFFFFLKYSFNSL